MKLPESTATVRCAGSMSSRAMESVRGSIRPCFVRRLHRDVAPAALAGQAAGDFRGPVAPRPLPRRRRSAGAPVQLLVDRPAVAAASPVTPRSIRWCAPSASGSSVDLDHGRVVADSVPCRMRPHVQRAAPADQQVGVLDQVGRDRGGEAAADVETERRRRGTSRERRRRWREEPPYVRTTALFLFSHLRAPRPARKTGRGRRSGRRRARRPPRWPARAERGQPARRAR